MTYYMQTDRIQYHNIYRLIGNINCSIHELLSESKFLIERIIYKLMMDIDNVWISKKIAIWHSFLSPSTLLLEWNIPEVSDTDSIENIIKLPVEEFLNELDKINNNQ